jgi:drug/metabolite transporter (DMT)-like permease
MTAKLPALFAAYTLLSVSGMVLIKHAVPGLKSALSAGSSPVASASLVAAGAAMYVLGFGLWMVILARTPLTIAYPIAVGLTIAFSAIAAVLVLGEPLKWQTVAGMLLIFAGVVLLAR